MNVSLPQVEILTYVIALFYIYNEYQTLMFLLYFKISDFLFLLNVVKILCMGLKVSFKVYIIEKLDQRYLYPLL
jgi:hypothetical protein